MRCFFEHWYNKIILIVLLTIGGGYLTLIYGRTPATLNASTKSNTLSPPLCAKYDGTNLFIAANDGDGTEMCYWFKKCMNNDLFTFFRVGTRQVDRDYSDLNGVPNSSEISWLNSTNSDNIGPVGIQGYADFIGGNHRWKRRNPDGSLGPFTTIHTANCNSYIIYIDGQLLSQGVASYGEQVCVAVNNTLFDPLVEP